MDEVVTVCQFEGGFYIFTKLGKVILMWREATTGTVHTALLTTLTLT